VQKIRVNVWNGLNVTVCCEEGLINSIKFDVRRPNSVACLRLKMSDKAG